MKKEEIIVKTRAYVEAELTGETTGHDWWHIYRVSEMAKTIAIQENADVFICEMAALLHDLADEKLNETEEAGIERVKNWLQELQLNEEEQSHIMDIVINVSFKGGGQPPMKSIEGQVVQDADRLDAIGAMGIARVFTYSGAKGQLMFHPDIEPRQHMTKEQYRQEQTTAINHFYEKLFKLKDLMNTSYGKQIAEQRHRFMEEYVHTFLEEWDGRR